MIAVNYSQTRANMKSIMDRATYNCETIIITRKNNENVVMLSEDTYNNLLENAHLTSEKANFDWLMESKKQLESKKVGTENVYLPLVIAASQFQKEKDHITGFCLSLILIGISITIIVISTKKIKAFAKNIQN
jgi:antitoxin YefM